MSLAALEDRLAEDLACLELPAKSWVPRRDGVTDVLVVGAGMCGLAGGGPASQTARPSSSRSPEQPEPAPAPPPSGCSDIFRAFSARTASLSPTLRAIASISWAISSPAIGEVVTRSVPSAAVPSCSPVKVFADWWQLGLTSVAVPIALMQACTAESAAQ
ncbi:hypothetical protein [Mangrovicoccus ximenensis]|uniref:hypothetical protein n=1 Tax=Mangrovicoccus ximenensis TaxID=1911570 RepID=UPI000D3AB6E3|nr:hypothetical protein [Mangrovicoccus ximenensis]